jgi:predicted oxidoreductase
MEAQVMFINLSPEAAETLAENDVDLLAELRKQGLEITRSARPAEVPQPEAGTKSVELIILASAASAPLVASGIARIIDALSRKKRAVVTGTEIAGAKGAELHSKHSMKVSFLGLKVQLADKYEK